MRTLILKLHKECYLYMQWYLIFLKKKCKTNIQLKMKQGGGGERKKKTKDESGTTFKQC